jgi:hypothetical protein
MLREFKEFLLRGNLIAVGLECPECLSQIPAGARRCAFCTAEVVSSP